MSLNTLLDCIQPTSVAAISSFFHGVSRMWCIGHKLPPEHEGWSLHKCWHISYPLFESVCHLFGFGIVALIGFLVYSNRKCQILYQGSRLFGTLWLSLVLIVSISRLIFCVQATGWDIMTQHNYRSKVGQGTIYVCWYLMCLHYHSVTIHTLCVSNDNNLHRDYMCS